MPDATAIAARVRAFAGLFVSREGLRLACGMMLAGALGFLALLFATIGPGGATAFKSYLGNDYAGFYTAATLLNRYEPARLYDVTLQGELFHRLLPAIPPHLSLIYAHAPFLAVVLRPLAWLPLAWSYAAWLAIAAALALAGLGLVLGTAEAIPRADRTTALLLALTFEPLLMETWLGGQMAVLGLFWAALALRCERRGRPEGVGAALAMVLYKPSLALLLAPMLVVGGRIRVLIGFAATGLGLAAFSLLAIGREGCLSYVRLLLNYARFTSRGAPGFQVAKHVDLNTFFTLLSGGPSPAGRAAVVAAALIGVPLLASCWWSARRGGADRRALALAATLSWTAVFNLYTPIYDAALVLPGVIVTADVLARRGGGRLPGRFRALLGLLGLVPWVSQALALAMGFQPLTLVLLALGAFQIDLARRVGADEVSG
ncbi:MAG TPA: glycosyltransferase family 87 protein [Isosphaeraceae bacterium]|jgi:hypothetical protein